MAAAQRASENIREQGSLLEEPQPLHPKRRWKWDFNLGRDRRQKGGGLRGRGGKGRKMLASSLQQKIRTCNYT